MDPRDIALQAACPVVIAPRFGVLPEMNFGQRLVVAANGLAGGAMGAYLLRAHPRLWAELRDHLDPESEHPTPG